MSKEVARSYSFLSSKGTVTYRTLVYTDGTMSCSCPGWCKRVAADGSRSCKHTAALAAGWGIPAPAIKAVQPSKLKPQPAAPNKANRKPQATAPTGYVVKRKFAI